MEVRNADGGEVCGAVAMDHPQCSLAQVISQVLPSELVRGSRKRELKASWRAGGLAQLQNGGMAMDVDGKRWEELGVEDVARDMRHHSS